MNKAAIRSGFLEVGAATVADVLDSSGLPNQGLSPAFQEVSGGKLAGWAYTIAGMMVPYEASGDPRKMEACQGIGPDEVSVWSGSGVGICYFGELIAVGMMQRGAAGALVDGGLRDTRALQEYGFAAYACYRSAVQSIGRWRVTEWQVPVYLPGATSRSVIVRPGDFVVADEDGAVVVPADVVDDVLAQCQKTEEQEAAVRDALREGMPLSDALEEFGHI